MKTLQFAEHYKVLPILAAADIAATATGSQYVDLKDVHWATFLVNLGAITGDSVTLTVEASSAGSSNATEAAVPFKYRLSEAPGTDSMGAITAATSAGATFAASDDNKTVVVELDPAALPSNPGEGHTFARLWIAPASDMTAFIVGAVSILQMRYEGNAILSAT